ncbi:putative phosphoesterase [Haloplanus vescus]|uniref:Putative phosphoesterase n=1 Tax=Haloplanus vescus TaxID=555874 RepID=A0A1H3YG25_9EURY|nr:putative phosphoesterase [Haloplanus vescus]
MARVEPVPGEPAAVADCGGEQALVVADYHAGIETGLRYERGVELRSNAEARRQRLCALCDRTDPDRVVVLGDLIHRIGDPERGEDDEIEALLDALDARSTPLTLVPGNHDGGVADAYGDRLDVTDPGGVRLGDVGFVHGHTWPDRSVLGAATVCMGHEHPQVRLEDEVGGGRAEKAWLRGRLRIDPFADHFGVATESLAWGDPELVVFPAFNDRSGGTWVNVEGQSFLSPFLPDALADDAEAYLLDGTRLGAYRRV